MKAQPINTQLEQFRSELYQSFSKQADAIVDLIDALSGTTTARSVVELSLEASFQRQYSSVYTAIDKFFQATDNNKAPEEQRQHEQTLLQLIAKHISAPIGQLYWLFGTDATSAPRQFARTLADRGFVHQPNTLKGNKPVTMGHQYAITAHLPEKEQEGEPPWIVPLIVRRITTQELESAVGAELLDALMRDDNLPWSGKLCLHVGDSRYSTPVYLFRAASHEDLIAISRFRSNRIVYRQPIQKTEERSAGHPTWYGDRFSLKDPETWHEPDEQAELPYITRRGRKVAIDIRCWDDMLMRGKKDCPMHAHPFRLVRICWLNIERDPIFTHPLWLIVCGKRRIELSSGQIQQAYRQRSDLEHFNRFGKQRLLMTDFQTPDVQREENWWQIVQLAYTQLYLGRGLVEDLPRPWERYLPKTQSGTASPSAVKRDFNRIIRQLGLLSKAPKPRGYSPGRSKGTQLRPRVRSPVIKKG